MRKTIILGMCDPSGTEPLGIDDVPKGAAGYRLWKFSGLTKTAWLRSFDRRNILPDAKWDRTRARIHADAFRHHHRNRTVIVLGDEAWRALGFRRKKPTEGIATGKSGCYYYFVPHPSGRNLWYNDAANRLRVGRLLRSFSR